MKKLTVLLGVSLGAIALAPGCTFGGIADYEIEQCKPAAKQSDDVCNRLAGAGGPCVAFQCDPGLLRCVEKTRDDDRDGDPSVTCGGTDCDDNDPLVSGKATEVCDRKDNNCNSVIDEGAVSPTAARTVADLIVNADANPIIVPTDVARQSFVAAFVNAADCIQFIPLQKGGTSNPAETCNVLQGEGVALIPHQPFPISTTEASGAVVSASGNCPNGRLVYRFGPSAKLDLPCPTAPGKGVALPAAAFMPQNANANAGVIAWYDVAFTERANPLAGCASFTPVALSILRSSGLKQDSPQSDIVLTTELATGSRPPALLAVEAEQGMLLASPLGGDVGVFFFNPDNFAGPNLPQPIHVASLANARSTALAFRVEAGKTHVALAAEIGCTPQASIKLALGTFENKALTFGEAIEIAPPTQTATNPSVAWVEARKEWWLGWVDDASHVHIQRLAADGKPIGAGIVLADTTPLGQVSAGESVFGLTGSAFVEVPLDCPQ